MRWNAAHAKQGFTLLEAIIALTAVAVLATMIYVYFGKAFLESVTPVTRLQASSSLQRVMENITSDCNVYPKWRKNTSYAANDCVVPTGFNGCYYKCTGSVSSGATEPLWPLSSGGAALSDGSVTWTDCLSLRTLQPLTAVRDRIGDEGTDQESNDYGKNADGTYVTYHVVRNRFTRFVNGVDQDGDASGVNKILKVTLRNENGETVTALFFSN